ncbi:hypothetical protein B0H16DRAFT_1816706 [Mycena metata]|uniref:Uncharacterized protein n=1 Tax=Mycena metata TaxID=1033252 RepID=A0AAD7H494_9AGAR|nr:hypothetical protein B0H16DRAFT_1816706 [Mycena metata]
MDASAIGRFHSTVAVLPAESMDVPAGGLARFLQQNLRFKVFLVAISVLEDRWATRTRNSLTARDLHEYYAARIRQNEFVATLVVTTLLRKRRGCFISSACCCIPWDSMAEFFLKECTETVALFRVSKQAIFLDYEEYDPHRTVEVIFVSRQPPRNFKRITVNDNPVLDFSTKEICSPAWTDAQRVVEATLLALSRVDGALLVETDSDGKVVGVQKESVDGLLADMVESPPERGHLADCLQGGGGGGFAEALALLCVRMKKPAATCLYAAEFHFLSVRPLRIPILAHACKLVNEYALDTALRFEPGSATRDKLDDVMERYIRPSVHLLDCALRPANTGWLRRHELTMLELILMHDAISNIMGFLFRLLDDGGQLPTDIPIEDRWNAPLPTEPATRFQLGKGKPRWSQTK